MKKIGAFLLILTTAQPVISQNVLKLERQLSEGKLSVADSIDILNTISRLLTFVNQSKSLDYANQALELALRTDDTKGIAYAYRNLSSLHSYNESYSISMEYIQRALEIFETNKDSVGIANCYISLGHTYRRLQNIKEEVFYHRQSFEIFKRLDDKERIGVTSHNLGESYYNAGDLTKAKLLTAYAIQINDSLGNKPVLSSCYKVMGIIALSEQKYELAKNYFDKVLLLSEALGENSQKVATAESLFLLASIFKIQGDFAKQLQYLLKTAEFSTKHGMVNQLQRTYQELILLSANRNDQQSVIKYINSYQNISDSLNRLQLADRYNLANNIIQVHKLSKSKNELEKTSLLQEQKIKSRNSILLIILVSIIILIWLLLKFVRLSRKLQTQNTIIAEQNADLEVLNTTKDRFFSIVAHDLKSPLASLKSFSSLLIDHYDDLSKDEILTMSRQLQNAVDNTIKMADNLITWAKIQMHDVQYKKEEIRLSDITNNIYEVYKAVAERKGIDMRCSVNNSLFIIGDKNQIEFIIRNLVNNAIKFTNSGGEVLLHASLFSDEEIEIVVMDNGVGIHQDVKEKLFTLAKKQSTNGTAGEKGTGLGLMLSYEFLQINGGKIMIESEVGKGSQFKIYLKRSNAA